MFSGGIVTHPFVYKQTSSAAKALNGHRGQHVTVTKMEFAGKSDLSPSGVLKLGFNHEFPPKQLN